MLTRSKEIKRAWKRRWTPKIDELRDARRELQYATNTFNTLGVEILNPQLDAGERIRIQKEMDKESKRAKETADLCIRLRANKPSISLREFARTKHSDGAEWLKAKRAQH